MDASQRCRSGSLASDRSWSRAASAGLPQRARREADGARGRPNAPRRVAAGRPTRTARCAVSSSLQPIELCVTGRALCRLSGSLLWRAPTLETSRLLSSRATLARCPLPRSILPGGDSTPSHVASVGVAAVAPYTAAATTTAAGQTALPSWGLAVAMLAAATAAVCSTVTVFMLAMWPTLKVCGGTAHLCAVHLRRICASTLTVQHTAPRQLSGRH
jgi:hypothetical protein